MTQLQCYGIIWYIRGSDISITIDEAKNYTNLETPEGCSPVYVTKFVAAVFVTYFDKDYTNQETTLKPKTKGLIH